MIGIRKDRQSVGKVNHILMKAAGNVLRVSKLIDDHADDLPHQNVTLIYPRLFALQIEPAEQLLFLGSEFDEAHAVAAVEGDNYFLYLYWLLRIPDTVSTRAELIAALQDPAKTYIELSNGISLTTEDDVNHPVTYDITGKTITGGTINIYGNTIVTFTGKGTVDSKLSLWAGGATFSAPDAVINGDVDFGSYSGSLTGGTFNGDINCYYGTIKGGVFYGNITSSSGNTQITGGTFYGSVANCEIDERAKVSVTFDTGDSAVDTQRVLRGQKAEKPADPVKDGWRFTGWHSDGKEYDFTEPVTADTVLTANWMSTTTREVSTAEKLTAALSGTDGIVKLTDDITITEGLKIERNVTVDLNGHVLRYDEEAEPGSIFRVKSDCTLTLTDSRPEAEHEDESLPAGGLITGGKGYRHDGGSGGYHRLLDRSKIAPL